MSDIQFYVYILASKRNGTLYVGVTNNIHRRVQEHKEGKGSSFTSRYKVDKLVYVSSTKYINNAIQAEKYLKHLSRKEKLKLIEEFNPEWKDLSDFR